MRYLLLLTSFVLVLAAYGSITSTVWDSRRQVRTEIPAGYIIPSKFSRILSFGYQGVLSDYLFLKTVTFIGGRGGSGQPLKEDDWQYVIQSLDVITDLDPYFADPYVLSEGLLVWDAKKPEEANRLLKKGLSYRREDWRLPYFVGFNCFYFLNDYETASEYIMKAARLSGSPSYLSALAARLAYYGGKSKTALLFLREMLAGVSDPLLTQRLSKRLTALERAVVVEEAVGEFRQMFGRMPQKGELVSKGFVEHMPVDPYGGDWVILENGRVFSTSKFADPKRDEGSKN